MTWKIEDRIITNGIVSKEIPAPFVTWENEFNSFEEFTINDEFEAQAEFSPNGILLEVIIWDKDGNEFVI